MGKKKEERKSHIIRSAPEERRLQNKKHDFLSCKEVVFQRRVYRLK